VAVHVVAGAARRADHAGKDEQQEHSQDILLHFRMCFFSLQLTQNSNIYCAAAQKRVLTLSDG